MVRKISDVRRENAKAAIANFGGNARVAAALGHKNAAFLSQMLGPKASRNVTEDTARSLEQAMGLPHGALDQDGVPPVAAPVAAAPASLPTVSTDLVAAVVRLVGATCEAERVQMNTPKFADLVALAYSDAVEHQGTPRPDHIKTLVRLAK